MTAPNLQTYEDVLVTLAQFASARDVSPRQEVLRYCVESALREIISARDWTCLRRVWRVPLQTPYSTGTATYAATGGTYDYQVTLTGGVTAAWMANAQIWLGTSQVVCDIEDVKSSTVLTLRQPRVPVADITTGVSFTIGRSWYELPPEFIAAWSPMERNAWYKGEYVPFEEWHELQSYFPGTGSVRRWTIGPAPDRYATLALYVDPWASAAAEYDFVMKCRPRSMAITGQDAWNYAGTVSVTAGETTVTGSSTLLRSTVAGAIARFSLDASKPTGNNGANPYVFQQSITAIDTAAQTFTLGGASPVTLSGVKCVVSDPVDLDIAVYDAFLRNCEKQLAHAVGMKDLPSIERQYHVALTQAKIMDNYRRQKESAGSKQRVYRRLADEYTATL